MTLAKNKLIVMSDHIYLDNNATTKVDPRVLVEMLPFFTELYGNASSINHLDGKNAAGAVQKARQRIANLIGSTVDEITFTSGATEAINMAIKGVYHRYQSIGKHIITCVTEHRAVLDVCKSLEKKGAEITYLPVDHSGAVALDELIKAMRKDTVLISFMYANNETGVIHPIEEISKIAADKKVLFFCDATQAVGKIPVSLTENSVDILAFSAHKMYGPKGVGAIYTRKKSRRTQLEPLINGGGQEKKMRGGTLNVPGIVGFGAAAELAKDLITEEQSRLRELRDHLERSLIKIEETYVNGLKSNRLSHVSSITFRFLKAEQIMARARSLSIASGSACSTGSLDPSHVLLAMGLDKEDAHGTLRFSLGRFNTLDEINNTIQIVTQTVASLREESPAWQLFKKGLIK